MVNGALRRFSATDRSTHPAPGHKVIGVSARAPLRFLLCVIARLFEDLRIGLDRVRCKDLLETVGVRNESIEERVDGHADDLVVHRRRHCYCWMFCDV